MAVISTRLLRTSRMSRKVYMPREKAEEASNGLSYKYVETYGSASSDAAAQCSAVADRRPALRLEARATDQQSVHAGRRQQCVSIGGRDAAAIQNGNRVALRPGDCLKLGSDGAMCG